MAKRKPANTRPSRRAAPPEEDDDEDDTLDTGEDGDDVDGLDSILGAIDEQPGKDVTVKRLTSSGSEAYLGVVPGEEFSLEAIKQRWGGGKYRLTIKDRVTKRYELSRTIEIYGPPIDTLAAPVAAAPVAPAPANESSTMTMMREMLAESRANQQMLLSVLVKQPAAVPLERPIGLRDLIPLFNQRTPVNELLDLMSKVGALKGEEPAGGMEDALIGQLLGKLLPAGGAVAATPPTAPVAAPPAAPAIAAGSDAQASPPAATEPPNRMQAVGLALQRVTTLLQAGAAIPSADPETYAELIDDTLCAAGEQVFTDAVELLQPTPQGFLTDQLVAIERSLESARPWLGQVEAALRERFKPDASEIAGKVNPAATAPPPAPAPGATP